MLQLTIIIPAYNEEKNIRRCLDSFIESGNIDERLELIVVNDGSTDKTKEIADEYAKRYSSNVRLINNENGGHGSALNAGIQAASGRYIKAVDGDDFVVTENISDILDALEVSDADVCITGYKSINEATGLERIYSTSCDDVNRVIDMERFSKIFDGMPAAYQYHGLSYKTDFFRSLDVEMSEGVFYEDQEYATLPFIKTESIMILQYNFYIYSLGDENRSVSYTSVQNRLGDMKSVIKKLIDAYNKAEREGLLDDDRKLFLKKRLSIAINSYYSATFIKTKNKKAGRKEAAGFRQFLEANNKEIADYVEKKYKALSKLSHFPGVAFVYNKLMESRLYLSIKRLWVK